MLCALPPPPAPSVLAGSSLPTAHLSLLAPRIQSCLFLIFFFLALDLFKRLPFILS